MIGLSVAIDENKGIGINSSLPWHIKEELQLFKKNTLNQNIIMGRTTYEHLPSKLKDRNIFVVSSQKRNYPDDIKLINDFQLFLEEHQNDEQIYIVCGGSSIYRQAYSYCKFAYLSIVKGKYEVDTYFDIFDFADWNIVEQKQYDKFTYYNLMKK